MMRLDVLSREDAEQVRLWRNEDIAGARTPILLTAEMQEQWYRDVVCNREGRHRYWAVQYDCGDLQPQPCWHLCGIAGLTNIEWENSRAEIALMIAPAERGKGFGREALELLLDEGFRYMGLHSIYGECYLCNPHLPFWRKMAEQYRAHTAVLKDTKYWEGMWWDSFWFCFTRG